MLIQGKYRVTRLLGQGSYSRVYEAVYDAKGTKVAIKFNLSQNEISTRLIEHEIEMYLLLKKRKAQNVISIKSFGICDSRHYLIMDLLPFTVVSYIQQYGNIDSICKQMHNIIQKLHEVNVMHRDIKPDNFMVSSQGNVYLIDMGLSSIYDRLDTRKLKRVIGSNMYCSFECLQGSYIYRPRCDIVSLFYVIFDLIAPGSLPWNHVCVRNKEVKREILHLLKHHTDYEGYYTHFHDPLLAQWVQKYILYTTQVLF